MAFAFSVDVDPGIANHVVIVVDNYVVTPSGAVAKYASRIDSQPTIEYAGTKEAGTYSATLTTRPWNELTHCAPDAVAQLGSSVPRYTVATIFLNDGKGHSTALASHMSWITQLKEAP